MDTAVALPQRIELSRAADYEILPPHPSGLDISVIKKPKGNSTTKPSDELVKASYNAGLASGRLEAIEESMDALARLIFKAEALAASLDTKTERALHDNASHTLRALHLAFAAITDSVNGSAAFHELLDQSRQRLLRKAAAMH